MSTASVPLRDAALAYARRGLRVTPLHGIASDGGCTCGKSVCDDIAKHPRIKGWQRFATTDEAQIRDWLRQWPRSNIGIATGPESGVFVLDVEAGEGLAYLNDLQMEHGLLPPTPTVLSGGGGQHIYFAWPVGVTIRNSVKNIAPGVDIRGSRGQAVAPPSLHSSGEHYQWLDNIETFAPAPPWLLERIAVAQRTITAGGAGDDGAAIPEGRRNDVLTSLAGRMRYAALTADEMVDALLRINRERCQPPLPEEEVAAIAQSIGRYPAGDSASDQADAGAATVSAATSSLGLAESKLTFRSAREIANATADEPAWIALGYIAEGAITEVDGKIKSSGKTTLLTYLARAVVDGQPFLGRATTKTPVVYLTEQSPPTFLQALRRADLLDRDDLSVLFWHDTIGVDWPEIVAAARAEAQRIDARFLIIDTLPQFVGVKGDAENNTGTALEAMRPLQAATAVDGLAIAIGRHDRKSGGEVGDSGRGSSAFSGAVDIVLQLRRPEGQSRPGVRVIKALSRYDETPETLVIELIDGVYVALGDAEAVATEEARDAILKAMPTNEGAALKEADLLTAAGVKRTVGQGVLREHLAARRIERIGAGKRGDPYRYWGLPQDDEKVSAAAP